MIVINRGVENWISDPDFLQVIFKVSDQDHNGVITFTEFNASFDILQQYNTATLITIYIRPMMLSKELFGIVIEEVNYL